MLSVFSFEDDTPFKIKKSLYACVSFLLIFWWTGLDFDPAKIVSSDTKGKLSNFNILVILTVLSIYLSIRLWSCARWYKGLSIEESAHSSKVKIDSFENVAHEFKRVIDSQYIKASYIKSDAESLHELVEKTRNLIRDEFANYDRKLDNALSKMKDPYNEYKMFRMEFNPAGILQKLDEITGELVNAGDNEARKFRELKQKFETLSSDSTISHIDDIIKFVERGSLDKRNDFQWFTLYIPYSVTSLALLSVWGGYIPDVVSCYIYLLSKISA